MLNWCPQLSVGTRLLKEVVAGMLVMGKGVEPNRRSVGFKSVVEVDAIIVVDANVGDPKDTNVD